MRILCRRYRTDKLAHIWHRNAFYSVSIYLVWLARISAYAKLVSYRSKTRFPDAHVVPPPLSLPEGVRKVYFSLYWGHRVTPRV